MVWLNNWELFFIFILWSYRYMFFGTTLVILLANICGPFWYGNFQILIFVWFSIVVKIVLEYSSYGFPKLWNHILLFTFQLIRFFLNVLEVLHHKTGIPKEHINSESIHVSSSILIAVIQWCCLVKDYTRQ